VTTFNERIDEVVLDFLETALVVDDDPMPLSRRATTESGASSGDEPSRIRDADQYRLDASPTIEALQAEQQDHPLNAKALTDAFADIGVVCAVIAPERNAEIQTRFLSAAARADLIVLDWEIHRDGGETAKRLLKAMLDQDETAKRKRLRLVAIYSGQDNLGEKIEDIRGHLGLSEGARTGDPMTLMHGNLRIGAFSKPLGSSTAADAGARHVAEEDLPRRLVSEFAHLTDGIVPAVTLAALAAIRNDTHRVLLALSSGLDLGYLGHRAVSPFPDDTQAHLVDIVSAEIGSVLSEADVGRLADMNAIDAWLQRARSTDAPLRSGSASEPAFEFSPEDVGKILRVGLSDDRLGDHTKPELLSDRKLKRIRKRAANLFTNDPSEGDKSADDFSMRMAVRTVYATPKRLLCLGTIVRHADQYLVCVQPRCDSVRLERGNPRRFPFLPFEITPTRDSQYETVVECPEPGTGLIRLHLRFKPYSLVAFAFEAADTGKVEAMPCDDTTWAFHDASEAVFTWVAELKPEFAQRVAVNLASEIARVGLSESEQLRLSKE
jgi:hypothetical protein